MKIHTNVLLPAQIHSVINDGLPGVEMTIQQAGSRSHHYAYNVNMTGNAVTGGQWGNMPDGAKTATWDEWGVVIGRLYLIDPLAVWGNVKTPIYESAEHFHWVTGNRFAPRANTEKTDWYVWLPADTHKRHRWEHGNMFGTSVTPGYYVNECKGCSAVLRRMAYGWTFSELVSL